ncbi:TadE/TadG family type IV pilus assembly protein [Arthrobacter sp. ZGTC131]|uniref:TadE/TadG family type IV pilus assembly protein n=1 Tax=Arthrobacter sp. ZGTC131 TaxID=2058898 RepID=UPI000CE36C16|nr:TadE/TadG family type IV pilus assembly protein [Arthrobacter sp. ZGTC131]
MRRIAASADGEGGGIAVIVALLMVVLLGFAAISIDVAKLYSERAQLQNGSDSVALMVAQKCAKNEADTNCSPTAPDAPDLANNNAIDNLSNVKSIVLDKPSRTVQVTAGATEAGSTPNSVSLFFARVLGIPSIEVTATSSVRWGSPNKGTAPFPITVSICQVRDKSGIMQLLQLHGKLKNEGCNYGPSGAPVKGGFGGLNQDTGGCGAVIDILAGEGGGDAGNNPPPGCEDLLNSWAADISLGREVIVVLPVFNSVTGEGSGAVYGLKTFAAFKVAGWKFSGGNSLPYTFHNRYPDVPAGLECYEAIQCKGIIGTFVEYVSLADGFELGTVDSDGVTVVELIS